MTPLGLRQGESFDNNQTHIPCVFKRITFHFQYFISFKELIKFIFSFQMRLKFLNTKNAFTQKDQIWEKNSFFSSSAQNRDKTARVQIYYLFWDSFLNEVIFFI